MRLALEKIKHEWESGPRFYNHGESAILNLDPASGDMLPATVSTKLKPTILNLDPSSGDMLVLDSRE